MTCADEGQTSILVVDAMSRLREGVFSNFKRSRFTIHIQDDNATAHERYQALQPDVVVIDAADGNKAAFELCDAIRSHSSRTTPVILTVTDDEGSSIDRAYQSGATDVITGDGSWAAISRRVIHLVRANQEQDRLRNHAAGLDRAMRMAHVGWWQWDVESRQFRASETLRALLGCDKAPQSFPSFLRRVHVQDRNRMLALAAPGAPRPNDGSFIYRLVREDGSICVVRQRVEFRKNGAGKPVRIVGTLHEIQDANTDEATGRHLAEFDSVTRLPNRRRLMDRMRFALDLAERNQGIVGVMFLDLDGFKRINDSLGHDAGDRVLCEAGRRLTRVIRKTDLAARNVDPTSDELVARFGGDEFVILLPGMSHSEDAFIVARRVIDELARPYEIGAQEVFTTVSVGIATYPADGTDPETLLKHADTAMYEVKESGKNGFRAFTESMNQRAKDRLEIESGLRRAIQRDELRLLYQPQFDVRNNAIVGAEALLRWKKEDGDLVSPGEFIWVAEEGNLILPLGRWVFEEVCRQLKAWEREGLTDVRVAINVSSRQFNEPRFAEYIGQTLAECGIPPSRLEFELTEGALMKNPEQIGDSLAELKSMGLKLALDDFGTGYASLSLLHRFPVDSVKVDRSFIRGLPADADSMAVTTAVLMMAQALGLTVTAEGVETVEQHDLLASLGCDEIQGFLMSPPISAEEFADLVKQQNQDRVNREFTRQYCA